MIGLEQSAGIARQLGLDFRALPPEAADWMGPLPLGLWILSRKLGIPHVAGRSFRLPVRAGMQPKYAPTILRELAADALLVDQHVFGGSTVAEHLGLPYVTVCCAMHWVGEPWVPPHSTGWRYARGRWARWRNRVGYGMWNWYTRPTLRMLAGYRQAWRLPPLLRVDQTFSPFAVVCQTCSEFDYPRTCLPDTFHYVGALGVDRPCAAAAFPWDRLDGRPLIYASLGTVRSNRRPVLFRCIAEACSDLAAQLVISTGKWERRDGDGESEPLVLPGDPLVLSFVPQPALLEKAHLLITHAGQNTVVEALTHGVPMVAIPHGCDQPAMAARVQRAGVGLRASSRRPLAQELRQLVGRVLGEESFRQRAGELRAAMLATGGVRRAADIAEQVYETQRPVLRGKTSD
ncbi:MAG: glycosyl transferase family 1 [Victivallales bacterium]|nr:glycosyl transferase family 1 [Victivallales bacterium]